MDDQWRRDGDGGEGPGLDLDALFRDLSRDVGPRVPPGPVEVVFRTARRRRARRRAAAAATALACVAAGTGLWVTLREGPSDVRGSVAAEGTAAPVPAPHTRLEPDDLLPAAEMPQVEDVYGGWSRQEDRRGETTPVCLGTPLSRLGAVEVIGRWWAGTVGAGTGEQLVARFPDAKAASRAEAAFVGAMPACRPNPGTSVEGPYPSRGERSPGAGARSEAAAAPPVAVPRLPAPTESSGLTPGPAVSSAGPSGAVTGSPSATPSDAPGTSVPGATSAVRPVAMNTRVASASPVEPPRVSGPQAWLMSTTFRDREARTSFTEIGIVRDGNVVSILLVTWIPAGAEGRQHPEFVKALDQAAYRIRE